MTGPRGITVRPPRPQDLAAVIRIEQASFSDPWSDAFLAEELANDVLRMALVAEGPEGVCGYVMAWRVAEQLQVLNIATDPALRRRGVGGFLLREAALRAWAQGLREITLEVRRSNTSARHFYRKRGLQELAVRKGYYAENGEDALIMTGPLDSVLDSD